MRNRGASDWGEISIQGMSIVDREIWDQGIGERVIFGYCDKVVRENGAKECPYGGTHNGTYGAVISEKGERSQVMRSNTDVTRVNVETPLGQNRLINS